MTPPPGDAARGSVRHTHTHTRARLRKLTNKHKDTKVSSDTQKQTSRLFTSSPNLRPSRRPAFPHFLPMFLFFFTAPPPASLSSPPLFTVNAKRQPVAGEAEMDTDAEKGGGGEGQRLNHLLVLFSSAAKSQPHFFCSRHFLHSRSDEKRLKSVFPQDYRGLG